MYLFSTFRTEKNVEELCFEIKIGVIKVLIFPEVSSRNYFWNIVYLPKISLLYPNEVLILNFK